MPRPTLSPRTALVVAGVVALVAIVVVVIGWRGGGGGGGLTTVSAAPAVGATASAPDGGGGVLPSPALASASASGVVAVVHVVGAVASPGLVTLPAGSRVAAALERAGGAASDADLARINLARPVVDGERLYVPRVGEVDVPRELDGSAGGTTAAGGTSVGSAGGDATQVVDLNSADTTALQTLPGIGPALAARIIAWREEHGRFSAPEDLLEVSGIGETRFAELRDRVRV